MQNQRIYFIWISGIIGLFFLLMLMGQAFSQETAELLFEDALFKKEVEGDLKGAIDILRRIIDKYPEKRKTAAKALLQIGACYEKLGSLQAQKAYRRVIESYPDQPEEVRLAQERLSFLLISLDRIEKARSSVKIRQIKADHYINPHYAAPSPDGRYLTFMDWYSGNLSLLELDSGDIRRLTEEATWETPNEYVLDSKISPDSLWVAYAWNNSRGFCELRLMRIDNPNYRVVYSDEDFSIYPASWSEDGQSLAAKRFNHSNGSTDIVLVSVKDGALRVLREFEKSSAMSLCISPDGQYIVFDSPVEKDRGNYDISIMSIESSEVNPLVTHPANDRLLGWVPGTPEVLFLSDRSGTYDINGIMFEKGRRIGYRSVRKSDMGQVLPLGITQRGAFFYGKSLKRANTYVAQFDLEGGGLLNSINQPLTGINFQPDWSPDGEKLAYVSESNRPAGPGYFVNELQVYSLASRVDRKIPCGLEKVNHPRWSPDGRYILVTGYDERREQSKYNGGIYVIEVQNGEVVTSIPFDPASLMGGEWRRINGEWAPDGKTVFYINQNSILSHDLETGQEKQIYQDPNLIMTPQRNRYFALSHDGKRIVFGLSDSENNMERLMIMPLPGGHPRELHRIQGSGKLKAVAWSPDDRFVLFTKWEENGMCFWRVSPEGESLHDIWRAGYHLEGLRVHPDGQQIAFYGVGLTEEIWVIEDFLQGEKYRKSP